MKLVQIVRELSKLGCYELNLFVNWNTDKQIVQSLDSALKYWLLLK